MYSKDFFPLSKKPSLAAASWASSSSSKKEGKTTEELYTFLLNRDPEEPIPHRLVDHLPKGGKGVDYKYSDPATEGRSKPSHRAALRDMQIESKLGLAKPFSNFSGASNKFLQRSSGGLVKGSSTGFSGGVPLHLPIGHATGLFNGVNSGQGIYRASPVGLASTCTATATALHQSRYQQQPQPAAGSSGDDTTTPPTIFGRFKPIAPPKQKFQWSPATRVGFGCSSKALNPIGQPTTTNEMIICAILATVKESSPRGIPFWKVMTLARTAVHVPVNSTLENTVHKTLETLLSTGQICMYGGAGPKDWTYRLWTPTTGSKRDLNVCGSSIPSSCGDAWPSSSATSTRASSSAYVYDYGPTTVFHPSPSAANNWLKKGSKKFQDPFDLVKDAHQAKISQEVNVKLRLYSELKARTVPNYLHTHSRTYGLKSASKRF